MTLQEQINTYYKGSKVTFKNEDGLELRGKFIGINNDMLAVIVYNNKRITRKISEVNMESADLNQRGR